MHANLMESGSNHQNFNSSYEYIHLLTREALSSAAGNVLDVKS